MCVDGGFNLTKFVSNTKCVFASILEDECRKDVVDLGLKFTMVSTENELESNAILGKIVLVLKLASKKNQRKRGVYYQSSAQYMICLGWCLPLFLNEDK